jgi:predicted GIY-YIG superfamily endonuclease
MKDFWVYMVRCRDGSLYTGHTDDLELRIAKHNAGTYDCYTSDLRPVVLVYSHAVETRIEALELERKIKGWSRPKKEALIRRDWAEIHDLARCGVRPSTRPR